MATQLEPAQPSGFAEMGVGTFKPFAVLPRVATIVVVSLASTSWTATPTTAPVSTSRAPRVRGTSDPHRRLPRAPAAFAHRDRHQCRDRDPFCRPLSGSSTTAT